MEKALDGRLKGQGWISYFSKSNEVVSLDGVWKEVEKMEDGGGKRRNLVRDVCSVKLRGERVIPV